jgi:DNA-binding CsgD family transcriptional regulator
LHLAERIQRRLVTASAERQVTSTLLERLPIAAVLVDCNGTPLASNSSAKSLAASTAGITLGRRGLGASTAELTRALVRTIQSVAAGDADSPGRLTEATLTLPRAAGHQTLHIRVVAVVSGEVFGERDPGVAAIVFIGDPECDVEVDPSRMAKLFQLTAAETKIAVGLANGLSVTQMALRLSVSRNTVRWHLKHILQKAGVKTQAQFVRLVHRSPAGLS